MSQEKAAEIIDINASRASAPAEAVETGTTGEALANARRGAGLSLAGVSADTKIKIEHLEAIEASDPSRLPATPFAVGFVKTYAGYLGLDADAIAAQFKDDIGANAPAPEEAEERYVAAAPSYASDGARLISLLGVAVIFAFAVWITWQIVSPKGADDTRRRPVQSVTLGAAPAGAVETVALEAPVEATPERAEPASIALTQEAEVETAAADVESANAVYENEETVAVMVEEAVTDTEIMAAPEAVIPDAVFVDEVAQAPSDIAATVEDQPTDSLTIAPPEIVEPTPVEVEPTIVAEAAIPQNEPPARRFEPLQTPPQPEEIIENATLRRSVAPRYPNDCTRGALPIESVTLVFDVTATGRIANARVASSTNSCFDQAAVSTVQRWRFNPRTVNGSPRPETGKRATLNFER